MITTKNTVFVIIDVQGSLAYKMIEREKIFENIQRIIQFSKILDVPLIITEQAPEKIGGTVDEIAQMLDAANIIPKVSFSCCGEDAFMRLLKKHARKNIVLAGIEAHVCVYQTAVDLVENGYRVQVIADAVSSRTSENRDIALQRLRASGITITSCEMCATELLRTSAHKDFKKTINLIK